MKLSKNCSILLLIAIIFVAIIVLFNVIHIQAFAYKFNLLSGLAIKELVPIKPVDSAAEVYSKNPKRLTNEQKSKFILSDKKKEILYGLYLGDLYGEKRSQTSNARLKFEQGISHKEYIDHLYELFKPYCSENSPQVYNQNPHKVTGKSYTSTRFKTYSLPCFNPLHDLFYIGGKKKVPLNIKSLFTEYSLAYLLADDGCFSKQASTVIICTDSFSLEEVQQLADTLNDKWNLQCYIIKNNQNKYRIQIPRRSLEILQNLLKNIMPPMMKHKIGL